MIYREYGKTGLKVSAIGLGGHEFGDGGLIRAFGENQKLAVTPGHIFDGFGGKNREEIVKKALDLGINIFDLTIDSEKEAMGRILKNLKPENEIIIQTRPEGMVYTYDPKNRKMANYTLIREEVVRILKLLGRETIDILNFAFMKEALEADPDYMDKIGCNIKKLKQEGLIRFASADTFSGDETYLKQINSGHFDSVFINYNINEQHVESKILSVVKEKGMGLLSRVAFRKGRIFRIAAEAGINDRDYTARILLKWIINNEMVTTIIIGVSDKFQLENNVKTLKNLVITDNEQQSLDKIFNTPMFMKEFQN